MRVPRLRFTVRVMMLLVLVLGIPLAWRSNKAHRQGAAVAAVRELGGSLVFDYDRNPRGRYSPNARSPRGPRWLRDILGPECSRTLRTIWVRRKVPDSELAFLQGLSELRTLHLHGADITDSGLSCLRSLPHLWGFLNDLRVTDAGLDHLGGLTKLESLALNGTPVTDAGLARVGRMTKLIQLGLNGTQVTDTGLARLKGLTGLKLLLLDQTRVTKSGVAELQKSLPNTKISWGN